MLRSFLITIFLLGLFFNCTSDHPKMPNTPEEVLKAYQGFFDKNEFESAKLYSTPNGKKWLEDLIPMIQSEGMESTIISTIFHTLDCTVNADTASCVCELEDDGERYSANYRLIRIKGQWLVDAPEEEEIIDYEGDEEIIESFFKKEGIN